MTRERARQLEAIALRLRDLDVGRQLRDYLE